MLNKLARWLEWFFGIPVPDPRPLRVWYLRADDPIEAINGSPWQVGKPFPNADSPWIVVAVKAYPVCSDMYRVEATYETQRP